MWYDHVTVACTYNSTLFSLLPSLSFPPPPFPQPELATQVSQESGPPPVMPGTRTRRGGVRLNTKLRTQSTLTEEDVVDTFWDRNFPTDDEVPWFRFQQAFLTDYEAQLSGRYIIVKKFFRVWKTTDFHVPWTSPTYFKVSFASISNKHITEGHCHVSLTVCGVSCSV